MEDWQIVRETWLKTFIIFVAQFSTASDTEIDTEITVA